MPIKLHMNTQTRMDAERRGGWILTVEPSRQPVKSFLSLVFFLLPLFETQQGKWSFFPPSQGSPSAFLLPLLRPPIPLALSRARPGGLPVWSCACCIPRHSVKTDWLGASWVSLKAHEPSGHWAFFVGDQFWCTMQLFCKLWQVFHTFLPVFQNVEKQRFYHIFKDVYFCQSCLFHSFLLVKK